MNRQRLNTFIRLLRVVQKQPSRTFDLGLIVKERESKIDDSELIDEIKNLVDIERIVYDDSAIDEDVLKKIVKAFKKEKWIFLEIRRDISSLLLNQLKHLANYNSFQLYDFEGKDIFEMRMPKSSRVVVFSERYLIENKLTYPHFYCLFGPTLSI